MIMGCCGTSPGSVSGAIIHMSSQIEHMRAPNRIICFMTKHAGEGITNAMGVQLAPYGMRVNSIAPNLIETLMTHAFFENKAFRRRNEGQGRLSK
jgi:NAD(P)-dependent dehydrogenase (short-subunit alcohol dehydrogenase family)